MENLRYPRVEIDLAKLSHNVRQVVRRCEDSGIAVAGVIKGASGIPECALAFASSGCGMIASSRLEQLATAQEAGVCLPLLMIRVPMLSEAAEVVRLADISLNSEPAVLEALNDEARRQDKKHRVILMADLGDLREGFWDKEELKKVALYVEHELYNLELAGVGTNLGCYGSIAATTEKLNELVACAESIEEVIGRELPYISGGATTSFVRVLDGDMPERINLLRIGEMILLAKDMEDLMGYDLSFMHRDVFTLKAEVVESKIKPSHPVGEITFDAFGLRQTYEDRGMRKRALLGLGKVDYAFCDAIFPRDRGVEILGASSDHTIVDVEEAARDFSVGDVMAFDLCYASLVYVTNSPNIWKVFLPAD